MDIAQKRGEIKFKIYFLFFLIILNSYSYAINFDYDAEEIIPNLFENNKIGVSRRTLKALVFISKFYTKIETRHLFEKGQK